MVPDDVRGGRRFVAAEVLSPSALSAPFPGVVWDTSVDAVLDAYRATFGVVTQLIVDSSSGAAARTVHSDEYVDFILEGSALELDERSFPLYFVRREDAVFTKPTSYLGRHTGFFFDEVTRATPEVCRSALLAAATALRAGEWVSSGASGEVRMGLAVCRPPGHHAFPGFGGGICIFANPAIAARALKESGTVAVLDLDADHGNGTQAVFYGDPDVLTVSLHAEGWPWVSGFREEIGSGVGRGKNLNLPLPRGSAGAQYLPAFDLAVEAIRDFAPSSLVVALGCDSHEGQSTPWINLSTGDFNYIGSQLGSLEMPTVVTTEGCYGYESTLAASAAFFSGWRSAIDRGLG